MKKNIPLVGFIIFLLGVAFLWNSAYNPPSAARTIEESHAGHDHEQDHPADSSRHNDDMDSLFEEPADPHDEHDHAAHEGHDPDREGLSEESADAHAGHDHDAHEDQGHHEDSSAHAGHDHGAPGGICPEHDVPEEEDALCHGDDIGELQPGEGMKVRLASDDVTEKIGVTFTKPQTISHAGGLAVPGRVEFNRNRMAHITPLAAGVVRNVQVMPGTRVSKGQILAELAVPEIASLKAQLLSARAKQDQTEATYRRESDLLDRGITSRQEFQQAESEYRSARSATEQFRHQLLNFGLSEADIEAFLNKGDSSANLPLRAPFSGTIVDVKTAPGEGAGPGTPLFTVADLEVLWVEVAIPESRIYQARVGAPVQATFDGLPGLVFSGELFQTGVTVDERSRTLKALAEVENPDRRLKVGMFGKVRLLNGESGRSLAVPADALQDIDGQPYVFVRLQPDLYELRRVRAGGRTEGLVPVLAGLSAADEVVASQGFALKSEILKARLGASCADH